MDGFTNYQLVKPEIRTKPISASTTIINMFALYGNLNSKWRRNGQNGQRGRSENAPGPISCERL